jgi:hypothetical protein
MLYPISQPEPNSAEDLIGFIDAEGRVIVRPSYAGGSYFFEGKACVVDLDGKSGFINHSGALVIDCRFKGLGKFRSGVCAINGGFLSHDGKWLIQPRFLVTGEFSEGLAFVSFDGEKFGFVDFAGDTVLHPEFQQCYHFSEGLAGVCHENRWGFIDHDANLESLICSRAFNYRAIGKVWLVFKSIEGGGSSITTEAS